MHSSSRRQRLFPHLCRPSGSNLERGAPSPSRSPSLHPFTKQTRGFFKSTRKSRFFLQSLAKIVSLTSSEVAVPGQDYMSTGLMVTCPWILNVEPTRAGTQGCSPTTASKLAQSLATKLRHEAPERGIWVPAPIPP